MKHLGVVSVVSMVIGFLAGRAGNVPVVAQAPGLKPAYLIASSRPIHPDQLGPYRQAAGPLALKAGVEVLGSGNPALHVLEGKWPYEGPTTMTVEKYRSMDDLLSFWNSDGYQNAKKLRAGLVDTNFIVAVEGR